MLRSLTRSALVVLAMALAVPTYAQEGHPLKGSWIGVWESNKDAGDDIIVVLSWDGKAVSGIINPGTDNMKIGNATLDPNGWKVHIEADGKNKQGAALHYVIDGTIKDLELPTRTIAGTWQSQSGKGKFEVRRQ
jgi:hypothetical protein